MRVFITGSASCLGKALLPALCAQEYVTEVRGIDIKPTAFQHPKLVTEIFDIRDKGIADKLQGFDAVIHLAFVVKRGNLSLAEMRDVNVQGGSNVVDAAKRLGIPKFINTSSVSVYGAGEDLSENAPLHPSPTFHYAQHKAELEEYIYRNFPQAIQLRLHLVIGKHAQDFLREMFASPFWLKFGKNKQPRQQVIHEDDAVAAMLLALHKDISGAFNLSAPEIIDLGGGYIREGVKEGMRKWPLPFWMVRFLVAVAMRLKPNDEFTWIELLDTSVTVDCARARDVLGWSPLHSPWDARRDAVESLRPVSL